VSCHIVGLGQGGEVEDGVDKVVHRPPRRHHHLPDVDDLRGALPNGVDTQDPEIYNGWGGKEEEGRWGGEGGTEGGAWGELVMNAKRKEGSGEERRIISRGKRREEGSEAK